MELYEKSNLKGGQLSQGITLGSVDFSACFSFTGTQKTDDLLC
jgi:hypothetical protein